MYNKDSISRMRASVQHIGNTSLFSLAQVKKKGGGGVTLELGVRLRDKDIQATLSAAKHCWKQLDDTSVPSLLFCINSAL